MSQAASWGVSESGPQTPTAHAVENNDSLDALLSQHLGASRPSYAVQGTIWNKDLTGGSPPIIETYLFDGTDDILISTFNISANTIEFNGLMIGTDVQAFDADTVINTLETPTATTSGTSHDYASIPAGTKQIICMVSELSTNGTDDPMIQIGDIGGLETSNYKGAASQFSGISSISTTNNSNGFLLVGSHGAPASINGHLTLTLEDSATNTWVASGPLARDDSAITYIAGGSKSLSAELDRIRLTTAGGTDTFDAGKFNISYE